jgi:hypothetical protein
MARPRKSETGRSETLSIRLDPQVRFVLEFLSRWRGQTITAVVERAIMEEGSKVLTPDQRDVWRGIWSVSEGERALSMARVPEVYPTFEEVQRLRFAEAHWPFFYADQDRQTFLTHYVDLLWPEIDHYVALFESSRKSNYWAAGEAMQDALAAARIQPPDWPPADHEDAMITDSPRKRNGALPLNVRTVLTQEDEDALARWEAMEQAATASENSDKR